MEVNNITNFYLNPSFKVKADSWNVSVQWGLRRYVYEQIYRSKEHIDEKSRKKQQAKAQSVTLLVSALWHGLYLGYFISFLNWVPCLQISQELYRIRNAKDSKLGKLWLKHATLFNLL